MSTNNTTEIRFVLKTEHFDDPLPHSCSGRQFRKIELANFCLTTSRGSNACVVSGSIVVVDNIMEDPNGSISIIGKELRAMESLYRCPCMSSNFTLYVVSSRSQLMRQPVGNITSKCVLLPHKRSGSFILLPLFHSNEFALNVNL